MRDLAIKIVILITLVVSTIISASTDHYVEKGVYPERETLPKRIHHQDFNKDGILDQMIILLDTNKSIKKPRAVLYVNGSTQDTSFFSGYFFSYEREGLFLDFHVMDSSFYNPMGREIIQMIYDTLFSKPLGKLDPALESLLNHMQMTWAKVDSPFVNGSNTPIKWYNWPAPFPKANCIMYNGCITDFNTECGEGWLYYTGYNHIRSDMKTSKRYKWYQQVAQNETYKIYRSAHGVIARKGEQYCWLYHTVASEKLRWPSVEKVWLFGKYVLITKPVFDWSSPYYYMINVETGKIKSINPDNLYTTEASMILSLQIKDKNLIISCADVSRGNCKNHQKKVRIPLWKLVREFEKGN